MNFDIEFNSESILSLDWDIVERAVVICSQEAVAFAETPMAYPIREDQVEMVREAIDSKTPVFVVFAQQAFESYPPQASCLGRIGVVARPLHVIETPEGGRRLLLECHGRKRVSRYSVARKRLYAKLEPYDYEDTEETVELIATVHQLYDRYFYYLEMAGVPEVDNIRRAVVDAPSAVASIGMIAMNMPFSDNLKYKALECHTIRETVTSLLQHLEISIQLAEIKSSVEERTRAELSDQQRENYIQAQIRQLQSEIGQGADQDIEDLQARAALKDWSEETQAHFEKEVNKLSRYNISSPDYSIQYAYLDHMLQLPWRTYSKDEFSLQTVEETLDRDHFGLEKVKERILEQMAVIKLRDDLHAPILCLVGPPGVGKTSLGKSIADAMGREYKRIAFGGMHDEAEIRGHRRTYIGAMPGRIIAALEKCSTSNPVIVLDEIDKIGSDFKGDPSSALLEVLDPEQNFAFHDNYLDVDYDLSKVLFIATANTLSTISAPLLDRMEIISLSGYITAEKVEIAKKHLVPKLLKEHGYEDDEIDFQRLALVDMIDRYTRESGVRQLEKMIAKVLRKIAVLKVSGKEYPMTITRDEVRSLLGKEEYTPDIYEDNSFAGVVTGLAWTSVGGEILFIESSVTQGESKLSMTGNLGDVMKESATIAFKYLKANPALLGEGAPDLDKRDIHIHVPEGAIPKDGPSAGITILTSIASALTGRLVRDHLAMTGEMTLRGKVLPVGGIKEKIIAAKRAGITEIILSVDNRKDVEEIQERYIAGLTFTYVRTADEVLRRSLLPAE